MNQDVSFGKRERNDLDRFLEEVVEEETEETAQWFHTEESKTKMNKDGPRGKSFHSSKPPAFHTTSMDQSSDRGWCILCKSDRHSITICYKFNNLKPTQRAELVKNGDMCFRYLIGKHRSSTCESRERCSIKGCRARHHTLLNDANRVYPATKSPGSESKPNSPKRRRKSCP